MTLVFVCLLIAIGIAPAEPGKTSPKVDNPWQVQEQRVREELRARKFPLDVENGAEQNTYLMVALNLLSSGDDAEADIAIEFLKMWLAKLRDENAKVYRNEDEVQAHRMRLLAATSVYERLIRCAQECPEKHKGRARKALDAISLSDPFEYPNDPWWILAPFFREIPIANQTAQFHTEVLFADQIAWRGDVAVIFGTPAEAKLDGVAQTLKLNGDKKQRKIPLDFSGKHIVGGAIADTALYVQDSDANVYAVEFSGSDPIAKLPLRVYPTPAWSFDAQNKLTYFAGPGLRVWEARNTELSRLCGEREQRSVACVRRISEPAGFAIVYESTIMNPDASMELFEPKAGVCEPLWSFSDLAKNSKFAMDYSSRHHRIAIADRTYVRLIDSRDGKEIKKRIHGADEVTDLAFSPDGRFLLCTGYYWSIMLCDAKTLEVLLVYSGYHGGGVKFGWAPDSKAFVSTAADQMLRVWAVPEQILESQPPLHR